MIKTSIIDPELALRMVRESPVIVLDTETTGLEHTDYVVGWVITNFDFSVYIPVRHSGGGNIPMVDEFELELADAFKHRGRLGYRTVGHHLGFDLRMAGKTGYGGKTVSVVLSAPLEDTMINESLIDDLTQGYGLEDCSRRHQVTVKLGDELYRELAQRFGGMPDRKTMKNFSKMPGDNPKVLDYTTGDGVSTIELWQKQQEYLDAENLRVPWKLECDLLPYLARMYLRGIKVDMGYGAQIMADDSSEGSVDHQYKLAAANFPGGFNPRSAKEVEALYLANGFTTEMFQRTPAGAASFTEKWLETNKLGEEIIKLRQLQNAKSKFIAPIYENHNHNGRLHPVLHQSKSDDFGVAGARFSCSDPNMQAVTKRNRTMGKLIRPLIIPDFGLLYEQDFQQQEPRLFTHYSEDPALLEGYRNGTLDMHDRANEMLFITEENPEGDRDTAKRMDMGMLSMMSKKALAGHMGWSLSQASDAYDAFLTDAFPLIAKFQQDVIATFKSRGYVRSILGRRARLENPRFAYQGVSRVIQNSGGDHAKTGTLRLCQYEDAYPDDFQVLMMIHDSHIFQTENPKHAVEAEKLLSGVAQEPQFNLKVPIPVDTGFGVNWSEASYIKRKAEWPEIRAKFQ